MKYNKILLKLSGEALKNKSSDIIDFNYILMLCKKIQEYKEYGLSIGIVVGGGNIWRGRDNTYIDNSLSDKIGILSTTINSLVLKACFDSIGANSVLFNSSNIEKIVEKIPEEDKLSKIYNDNIIIFGGGTGDVGCSTDTAAALLAKKINSDIIVKLTNVDGIYDKDPKVYKDAKKYKKISFDEVIDKKLNFMDLESIKLCSNNDIRILVMNIKEIDKLINELDEINNSSLVF